MKNLGTALVLGCFYGCLEVPDTTALDSLIVRGQGQSEELESLRTDLEELRMLVEQTVGMYCGHTAANDGLWATENGYEVAKAQCELACSNSPTAHVCSAHELTMSLQFGVPVELPEGGTESRGFYTAGVLTFDGFGDVAGDCQGWSQNASDKRAYTLIVDDPKRPSTDQCSEELPFLCCDSQR